MTTITDINNLKNELTEILQAKSNRTYQVQENRVAIEAEIAHLKSFLA